MTPRFGFISLAPQRSLLLGAGLAVGLLSCARNPVTGKSELALVSESQEIQMGQEASKDVARTIGLYKDPKLEAYVAGIGKRMAAASERPNLPWEFHVVDDASVNAFALPGGFIYVTRGLLASINDEAELATVVGHEIGHVTNRHSVQQISKQQLAQLGLGVGSILSSDIARFGQLASAGLSVLFLKYGRDAENQADQAGFRYALNQDYDVREMTKVFETLDRISQASGGGKLPEWLSTHPAPENRIQHIENMLDTLHRDPTKGIVNREGYIQHDTGHDLRGGSPAGLFRGYPLLSPSDAVPDELSRWMAGTEHPIGGCINESKPGCHHSACARGTDLAAAGRAAVPVAARHTGGTVIHLEHQWPPGGVELLPGANRPGIHSGDRIVHLVWRSHLRTDGVYAGRKAQHLRSGFRERHQELR